MSTQIKKKPSYQYQFLDDSITLTLRYDAGFREDFLNFQYHDLETKIVLFEQEINLKKASPKKIESIVKAGLDGILDIIETTFSNKDENIYEGIVYFIIHCMNIIDTLFLCKLWEKIKQRNPAPATLKMYIKEVVNILNYHIIYFTPEIRQIIGEILTLNPEADFKDALLQMANHKSINDVGFIEEFKLALNSKEVNLPLFHKHCTSLLIRRCIALNPAARKLPEYVYFIPPEFGVDIDIIFKNPKSELEKFKEYHDLFDSSKTIYTGNFGTIYNSYVDITYKMEEYIQSFPESINNFNGKQTDLLFQLLCKPQSLLFPKIQDFINQIKHAHDSNYFRLVSCIDINPALMTPDIFHEIFILSGPNNNLIHLESLYNIAKNPEMTKFPEYRKLFEYLRFYSEKIKSMYDDYIHVDYYDSAEVFESAEEEQENKFKAYISEIRATAKKNPPIPDSFIKSIIQAIEYNQKNDPDIFEDIEYYLNFIMTGVAENPNAIQFPEYRKLFSCINEQVRAAVAKNPQAVKLEDFSDLFNAKSNFDEEMEDYLMVSVYPDSRNPVVASLAGNPKAIDYPEFRGLFYIKPDDDPDDTFRNLGSNPEATKIAEYRRLFYECKAHEGVAENPNACKFGEFRNLFYHKDKSVRLKVAENPNALHFPDYTILMNDIDFEVKFTALRTYYNHLNEQFRKFAILPSVENTPKVQACEKITDKIDKLKIFDNTKPEFTQILTETLNLIQQTNLNPIPQTIITPLQQLLIPKNILKNIEKDYKELVGKINLTEDNRGELS